MEEVGAANYIKALGGTGNDGLGLGDKCFQTGKEIHATHHQVVGK